MDAFGSRVALLRSRHRFALSELVIARSPSAVGVLAAGGTR
jgi:hypothetical protein